MLIESFMQNQMDCGCCIADRYDDVIVLQCLTAGAEYWRKLLLKN
jgi:23S rRNA G2069 N7-methylase RlmK/C1962 C5-methylase RlmI